MLQSVRLIALSGALLVMVSNTVGSPTPAAGLTMNQREKADLEKAVTDMLDDITKRRDIQGIFRSNPRDGFDLAGKRALHNSSSISIKLFNCIDCSNPGEAASQTRILRFDHGTFETAGNWSLKRCSPVDVKVKGQEITFNYTLTLERPVLTARLAVRLCDDELCKANNGDHPREWPSSFGRENLAVSVLYDQVRIRFAGNAAVSSGPWSDCSALLRDASLEHAEVAVEGAGMTGSWVDELQRQPGVMGILLPSLARVELAQWLEQHLFTPLLTELVRGMVGGRESCSGAYRLFLRGHTHGNNNRF